MALAVCYKIDGELEEALQNWKTDDKVRAIIVTIENEVLKLHNIIPKTDALAKDLLLARSKIACSKQEACFLLISNESTRATILLVPETAKPKEKMLYATGAGHLTKESGVTFDVDKHITTVDDLVPDLLQPEGEKADREDLMTNSERIKIEHSKMEVVPAAQRAGVEVSAQSDVDAALEQFLEGRLCGVAFSMDNKGKVKVAEQFPSPTSPADMVAGLPTEAPRFFLVHWEEAKDLFVYFCPPVCKPRERMVYASSKAGFVDQISSKGVQITKKLEMDTPFEMEGSIKEALSAPAFEDDCPTFIAPKPMPKGARMLMS